MNIKAILFALLTLGSSVAYCREQPTPGDYALDIGLSRPVGLISTLTGTIGFIATLPCTLSISAFTLENAVSPFALTLIANPVINTFDRPLGTAKLNPFSTDATVN